MLLSELPTDDPRCFGGVVLGDVEDDGCDVESPELALALECWRATGCFSATVELLHLARPGEPWAEWVHAAMDGWREVARWKPVVLAAALASEASRAELKRIRAAEAAVTKARAAVERAQSESVAAVTLLEEVLRGG